MSAAERSAVACRNAGSALRAPEVSLVGLGANNFGGRIDFEASRRVVDRALDLGITLIDTADTYGNKGGSEEFLGRDPRAAAQGYRAGDQVRPADGRRRQPAGASRRYIMQAVEASLRRLKTDWIDLYQLHRPDPQTPIEETLRALDDLVQGGKGALHRLLQSFRRAARRSVTVAQRRSDRPSSPVRTSTACSIASVEKDRLPIMRKHGLGLLPYFPLASGLLTGKYKRNAPLPPGSRLAKNPPRRADDYLNERNWRIVDALDAFAAQRGHTLLELAMSWLASRPFIPSIIAGATKPEQVEQNIAAVGWPLSAADLAEIDRITL